MMRINNIVKQAFFYPVLLMGWLLLSPQSGWAFKKKIDPRFEARKKRGVAQLKQLIRQNKENNRKGLGHQNWYIIGDPVHLVGEQVLLNSKYGMFTPEQIQEANELLNAYNQSKGSKVVFYAYLTGFKVPLVSPLDSIDVKDYPEFEGKEFREFHKELNRRRKKIQHKEAQAYEAKLLKGIFTEVEQEIGYTKNLVVYGHTIYLDPRLTEAKELKYGTQDFINFVMSKQASASYQYRFRGLGNLMKGITRRADETNSAYHLRAHIKAGIKVLKGGNNQPVQQKKGLVSVKFGELPKVNEDSPQDTEWQDAVNKASQLLKGEMPEKYQYIGDYTDVGVVPKKWLKLWNKKFDFLKTKTGIRVHILYHTIRFNFAAQEPGKTIEDFTRAVWRTSGLSNQPKALLLLIPIYALDHESPTSGLTYRQQVPYAALQVGAYLQQAFPLAQDQSGRQYVFGEYLWRQLKTKKIKKAEKWVVSLYDALPKPHQAYIYGINRRGEIREAQIKLPVAIGRKRAVTFSLAIQKPHYNSSTDLKWYRARREHLKEAYIETFARPYVTLQAFRMYGRERHYGKRGEIPKPPPPGVFVAGFYQDVGKMIETSLQVQALTLSFFGMAYIPTGALIAFYVAREKWTKASTEAGFAAFGTVMAGGNLFFLVKLPESETAKLLKITRGNAPIFNKADEGVSIVDPVLWGKLDELAQVDRKLVDELLADFGKDLDLLEKVAKNPELVEGWKVLQKSGADEATRLGKFEEMKKFMDSPANKGKSIDDLAKEVKDFGGYKEWVKYEKMGGLVRHKIPSNILDELSKIDINVNNLPAIEAIIAKHTNNEIGFLFGKDGKVLAGPLLGAVKEGEGVAINLTEVIQKLERHGIKEADLKGTTFTHNHPIDGEIADLNYLKVFQNDQTGWTPGTLSFADIENASELLQKEIRATTELGHTFILRNTDKTKNLPDVTDDLYDLHSNWIKALKGRHTSMSPRQYLDDFSFITKDNVEKLYQLARKRAQSSGDKPFDLQDFVDHEIWEFVIKALQNEGYPIHYSRL